MENAENLANLTFILGGARSGKSALAERLAGACAQEVLYVATAEALDDEMAGRIRIHQTRRPAEWRTLEAPRRLGEALTGALRAAPAQAVIVDCLSVLTSNVLLTLEEGANEAQAFQAISTLELLPFFAAVAQFPNARFFAVSNETGMGVVPAYALGRLYRDALGRVNQSVAAAAGTVYFMAAGIALRLKPQEG